MVSVHLRLPHKWLSRARVSPWLRYGVIAVALILATEIVVRAMGMVSFPIYKTDSQVRYIPIPNQNGRFLNSNDWYINDISMPIAKPYVADLHPNVLLIGNSIIYGGNPYKQKEKLTSRIQDLVGHRMMIWPIAAGGWTQVNEIGYLNEHPSIADNADFVAWEYMSGGLSRATPWVGEYVWPTRRPSYATWYVLRRYVLPHLMNLNEPSELPATGAAVTNNVQAFDRALTITLRHIKTPCKGIIWLYPKKVELAKARRGATWLPERDVVAAEARAHDLELLDLTDVQEWKPDLYRSDGTHPSVEGIKVLATILSREILSSVGKNSCSRAANN